MHDVRGNLQQLDLLCKTRNMEDAASPSEGAQRSPSRTPSKKIRDLQARLSAGTTMYTPGHSPGQGATPSTEKPAVPPKPSVKSKRSNENVVMGEESPEKSPENQKLIHHTLDRPKRKGIRPPSKSPSGSPCLIRKRSADISSDSSSPEESPLLPTNNDNETPATEESSSWSIAKRGLAVVGFVAVGGILGGVTLGLGAAVVAGAAATGAVVGTTAGAVMGVAGGIKATSTSTTSETTDETTSTEKDN